LAFDEDRDVRIVLGQLVCRLRVERRLPLTH